MMFHWFSCESRSNATRRSPYTPGVCRQNLLFSRESRAAQKTHESRFDPMTNPATSVVKLPEVVDIRSILEVRSLLSGVLKGEHAYIDASAIDRIDTAGMQLLVAVASRTGLPMLSWQLSAHVRSQLDALGFDGKLFREGGAQ